MKKSLWLLVSATALTLAACSNESVLDEFDEVCENITCGGNGTCIVTDSNTAACQCNPGYHASETDPASCVKDGEPDPCEGITCSDHGSCIVTDSNTAACQCNPGYHASETDPASVRRRRRSLRRHHVFRSRHLYPRHRRRRPLCL